MSTNNSRNCNESAHRFSISTLDDGGAVEEKVLYTRWMDDLRHHGFDFGMHRFSAASIWKDTEYCYRHCVTAGSSTP